MAKMPKAPPVERESLETAQGVRDSPLEPGQKDIGDAKSIGPYRAARVISPTRDAKRAWNWSRRIV